MFRDKNDFATPNPPTPPPSVCPLIFNLFLFSLNKHTVESSLEGVGRLWQAHSEDASVVWGQKTIHESADRDSERNKDIWSNLPVFILISTVLNTEPASVP